MPHFAAAGRTEAAHVWAWDARPFPAWPLREDVWGDGANWARGHWLNGRSGLAPLAQVVADICAAGGVGPVETRELDGVVEGYALEGVSSVRAALEPLQAAFGFEAVEREAGLVFRMTGDAPVIDVDAAHLGDAFRRTRQLMDKAPERLRLTCIDPDKDHEPMVVEARRGEGDARLVTDVVLPLALSQPRAEALAAWLLELYVRTVSAEVTAGPALAALEPGDRIRIGGSDTVWRIEAIADNGIARQLTLAGDVAAPERARAVYPGTLPPEAPVFPDADLVVMDAPSGAGAGEGPLVAAFADPWPGEVTVIAGPSADDLRVRARLPQPAVIARLAAPVSAGPAGRWDRHTRLEVQGPAEAFTSRTEGAVLAGGNAALLETEEGWELIQFQQAELTGPGTWQLSGLLRGQGGSVSGAAEAGARLVLLYSAVQRADLSAIETGMDLVWKTGGASESQTARFDSRETLPWQPCQLRVRGGEASWLRRGPEIADSWTFPEAPNGGRYAVEFDLGDGFEGRIETEIPGLRRPAGHARPACGGDRAGWPHRSMAFNRARITLPVREQ